MREILVVGEKKSARLDPLKFEIEVFEQGMYPQYDDFGKYRIIRHEGRASRVKVDAKEPLLCELEHFLECAKSRKEPISCGQIGADMVKICEAALASSQRKKAVVFDGNGNWS
jgi:predicted dehydrogenase